VLLGTPFQARSAPQTVWTRKLHGEPVTSLSAEELYEHLQSMDEVEKSVRVVRNSLLLPPLSNVYKLLHTSREAVWDGVRTEMPSLPVAKTISKAWNSPGKRLGRSALIRIMRAAQSTGIVGVLSGFLDLEYHWPPGNEWAGLFASNFFSQDISKNFWISFVKEVMHLNAIELHRNRPTAAVSNGLFSTVAAHQHQIVVCRRL